MRFNLLVPIKALTFQGGSSLQHRPHCCQSTPVTSWCSPDHSTALQGSTKPGYFTCSSLFLPLTWLLGLIKHTSEKALSSPCNHSDKTWHCADPAQIVAPLLQVGTRAVPSAEGLLLIPGAAGDHWEWMEAADNSQCWARRWELLSVLLLTQPGSQPSPARSPGTPKGAWPERR